jgi:hypothetical protein
VLTAVSAHLRCLYFPLPLAIFQPHHFLTIPTSPETIESAQDFKRTRIPFDAPTKISKTSREIFLNDYGKTGAVLDRGVLIIQVKKLKGEKREVLRINTTDIRLTC